MLDKTYHRRDALLPVISLLTSTSTLLCCALPALLVTLGFGASLAGLISVIPWLTVVSAYKGWLFTLSGSLLVIAFILQWQARRLPCPTDPVQAKACQRVRQLSWLTLAVAGIIYLIGFFFAFLAVDLL